MPVTSRCLRYFAGTILVLVTLTTTAQDGASKAGVYSVTPRTPENAGTSEALTPAPTLPGGSTATVSNPQAVGGGAGVQLITGGNSVDGAARVSRMPILD
mgnify:CR=1 FL=1|jgi:hypothetical protein